jgi:hypothetical protein
MVLIPFLSGKLTPELAIQVQLQFDEVRPSTMLTANNGSKL